MAKKPRSPRPKRTRRAEPGDGTLRFSMKSLHGTLRAVRARLERQPKTDRVRRILADIKQLELVTECPPLIMVVDLAKPVRR